MSKNKKKRINRIKMIKMLDVLYDKGMSEWWDSLTEQESDLIEKEILSILNDD